MAKIRPVNLESDTFQAMKNDMTASINRLLRQMQKYGAEEASLTLKLSVSVEEQELDDGGVGLVPTFEHKVTTAVQVKSDTKGKLAGEFVLDPDGRGGFILRPLSGQLDMFEEEEAPTA